MATERASIPRVGLGLGLNFNPPPPQTVRRPKSALLVEKRVSGSMGHVTFEGKGQEVVLIEAIRQKSTFVAADLQVLKYRKT